MMIDKNTRFSAVKAFFHWWVLGMVGLLPMQWLAEAAPTDTLKAVFLIAGLAWFVAAAWIVGRRDGYTQRVFPAPIWYRRRRAVIIHNHYFRPASACMCDGCHPFAPHYDDDD